MKAQNWISVRFLIGLSKPSDRTWDYGQTPAERESMIEARRLGARHYLGQRYAMGGSYTGIGYWNGQSEPCMSWETILPHTSDLEAHAQETARELARMLEQECVGLVLAPVNFQTVAP